MFKKNYFPKYLEEKAKNLATKEDIKEITSQVEKIKQEYDLLYSEIKNNRERLNAKQFELYSELWSALIELKISADELWNNANKRNLSSFITKLSEAKTSIMKSSILIEDKHYQKLIDLIARFEDFEFGKKKLVGLKNRQNVSEEDIRHTILENKQVKDDYDNLTNELKHNFKQQLKKGFE